MHLRRWIYTAFVKRYGSYQWHALFRYAARFLEILFNMGTFNYGGVKLLASPVAYLDRFIISGKNINPYVTSAFKQSLSSGGVFLDIGANHGVLSLLAARNPQVEVFAFEPSSRELCRLWKNLALNPTNNISVLSYGVSNQLAKQTLALAASTNPGMNSLPAIYKSKTSEVCNFTGLTQLFSNDILLRSRVCKLDVEGQELIILRALLPHLALMKQCVFIIEISPTFLSQLGHKADDIYNLFAEAGFSYQFGPQPHLFQWDDIFYHPNYSSEIAISEAIS